jgi:hypothetical protein
MFNQKINGYLTKNEDYLNGSYSAPKVSSLDIHNCGTTINKYTKSNNCSSLPLQSWCSANVAVESFGMRPIVNPQEYFENINKFLTGIIYTDSIPLKKSKLSLENYTLLSDYGSEPLSSFIQAIQYDATEHIQYYLRTSADQVDIFKKFNPIGEGFVMTDITITTYRSTQNKNHFFHRILFSAFNTTRYNTISFKAEVYQDTTPMMNEWNYSVNKVLNSQDVNKNTVASSKVYVSFITVLNTQNCITGQESQCGIKGHNISSSFEQLLNDNFLSRPTGLDWLQPDALIQNQYNQQGNYDENGNIRITDNGPNNLDELIKKLI